MRDDRGAQWECRHARKPMENESRRRMRDLLDASWYAIFVLEIVEDRYGRGGVLITSQIPIDRWHDFAILDWIVDNAHRLQLRVDSCASAAPRTALPLNVTSK